MGPMPTFDLAVSRLSASIRSALFITVPFIQDKAKRPSGLGLQDCAMTNHRRSAKTKSSRKLPSGLIALAVFVAFALMGALFGFGRSGNSGGAIGAEICRATCTARGWRDGSLVPPERAATGTSHGPKTCQCR